MNTMVALATAGWAVVTRCGSRALLVLLAAASGVVSPTCVRAQSAPGPDAPSLLSAPAEAERFHRLAQELRCVVCQNESLADSTAPLAQDLKREIRAQMAAGRTDDDIKAFLVSRYGDFITYRPPLRVGTLLLWGGPLVFLLVAGWVWWRNRMAFGDRLTPVEKNFGDNA